ncbi:MAG: hypothetical protein E7661_07430 [Ruminococcaceae bacterium]|nr:hypothetical protein [Oscillospiraceae bacterium]
MKRIVSIFLMICMVATLCVSFASCETEAVTPYTRLRDQLKAELPEGQDAMELKTSGNLVVYLQPEVSEELGDVIHVTASFSMGTGYDGYLMFMLKDGVGEYKLEYFVYEAATKSVYHSAEMNVSAKEYTGDDFLVFSQLYNIPLNEEFSRRKDVTSIFNLVLNAMDVYFHSIDLSLTDFGFTALADRYRVPDANVSTEEDLGGLFSSARLAYSGQMILLGVSMVFLVLAILWAILAIFAKTMGGVEKPAKQEKPAKVESKPAPATPVAPAAPVATPTSDDAIVAAITAAIAMTIESDPALSSQFAGGFRVVSFKKSGKNAWNR